MEQNKNNVLDISFNISEDQLANRILDKIENKISNLVVERICNKVGTQYQNKIDSIIKETESRLEDIIESKLASYVEKLYDDFKIPIRKDGRWDSETTEVSIKEYVIQKTQEEVTKGIKVGYGYSTKRESLHEYFDSLVRAEVTSTMEKDIKNHVSKIKDEVNEKIKSIFDDATKTMLSTEIFNILMSNDTFRKIQNNIKLLGD